MEPDGDTPPFWSQSSATLLPRRRRPPPSPLLNPVALILTIPILLLLIIFFILPPFLSHANQILKPNSVKKGWDSFNILLVLFAVLCGVFALRNHDASSSGNDVDHLNSDTISNVSSFIDRPRQSVHNWSDFNAAAAESGGRTLRRSSSSYPDLRQEQLWDGGNRSRFFDDFEVNFHRSPPPDNFQSRPRRSLEAEGERDRLTRRRHGGERDVIETVAREIPVDKFEVSSAQPLETPPRSSPPPPPSSAANLKRRRSFHSVRHNKNVERRKFEAEFSGNQWPPPPPAPPPPPPPPRLSEHGIPLNYSSRSVGLNTRTFDVPLNTERTMPFNQMNIGPEHEIRKLHRKKSGTTKEIATAIASLYKGRNKKVTKSRNIYEGATHNSPPPSVLQPPSTPPPPPPPPPPQPSKVLQNLFKKSGKSKRVHSVPRTAPPPPPPPPPNSIFNNLFKTGSKSKRFQPSSTAPPPPPPPPPPSSILNSLFKNGSKSRRFKNVATAAPPSPPPRRRRDVNAGKPPKPTKPSTQHYESIFIAPPSPLIPPPPPPPPFRMSEFKFVARGDFVRIRSAHSSRCSSPELEDVDVVSVKSDGGDPVGPTMSCPSPDVNAKADSFIARLRDEWRLEKANSMKEKRMMGR